MQIRDGAGDGIDPAPLSMSGPCSMEQIREDGTSCQALCSFVACCFSSSGEKRLVEKFHACLDYAPCQNLLALEVDDEALCNNSTNHNTSAVIIRSVATRLDVAQFENSNCEAR
jgi:hypothetical protein